jgi:hypothetical protein
VLQNWLYHGSWLGEGWTTTLRVEGDRLYGVRKGTKVQILPVDIVEVREFAFNNPFLLVTTKLGRFHVGARSKHYDDVVRVLEAFVGREEIDTESHRWNVLL